jgi:hypothetical protein
VELRVGRHNIRSQISDALALAASGRVDPGRAASRCDSPTLAAIAIRFRARRRPELHRSTLMPVKLRRSRILANYMDGRARTCSGCRTGLRQLRLKDVSSPSSLTCPV